MITGHAICKTINLLDILHGDSILLEQSTVKDKDLLLQHSTEWQRAETLRKKGHNSTIVLGFHFTFKTEHFVNLFNNDGGKIQEIRDYRGEDKKSLA